jgi:hypothetical protein
MATLDTSQHIFSFLLAFLCVYSSVADPDDFWPDQDPTFEKARILTLIKLQTSFLWKFVWPKYASKNWAKEIYKEFIDFSPTKQVDFGSFKDRDPYPVLEVRIRPKRSRSGSATLVYSRVPYRIFGKSRHCISSSILGRAVNLLINWFWKIPVRNFCYSPNKVM